MTALGLGLSPVFLAGRGGDRAPIAFTSAQDGDWNSASTWTADEDYPRLAGDTVTVSPGHEVTIPTGVTIECGAIAVMTGTNASTNRTQVIINGSLRM